MFYLFRQQALLFTLICASAKYNLVTSVNKTFAVDVNSTILTNDELVKKIQKIESLVEKADKIEELLYRIEKMISNNDLNKNINANFKVEELLYELIERYDQKMNGNSTKTNIVNEMTSQCNSMCQLKVETWAKETVNQFKGNLQKLSFRIMEDNSAVNTGRKASSLCDSNPCLHGGRCIVSSCGTDYQCTQCPYPMTGKNCERIYCGNNKCFRSNDTVYVVFETDASWEQANEKCASNGMRLAMPKEMNTTEFVINQLRRRYKPADKFFRIGLKRQTNGWEWIDATPLGSYVGGWLDYKDYVGHRCGTLYLHGGTSMWSPQDCIPLFDHAPFYPLCENNLI